MQKKFFLSAVVIYLTLFVNAQQFKSIHQEQLEYYKSIVITNSAQADSIFKAAKMPHREKSNCQADKIVYGWHPYWVGSVYQNYQWNLLSDLCFFSYEVDASTGNAVSTHGWSTAAVVDTALAKGVRVHLCVTLFSNHATFFGSTTAQQTLINNLINLVQSRGAHGVNIDFEGVPASQKNNFTNFMINLCNQMHTAIPGSMVSMATYAVDWNGVFDLPVLNNYVDLFIIMGYDYYWSGSSTAGPNDPLYTFSTSYNYNLVKSMNYYLSNGVSKNKLALGLPYYGREWPTTTNQLYASTTGSGVARTYAYVKNNPGTYNNKQWHYPSHSEYYVRQSNNQWYQCFISEELSLRKRLDMVRQYGIAGIGIWALGYDDGYTAFWDALKDKLSTCAVTPCQDSIFDNGGPSRDYLPNSDYTFTINPQGSYQLQISFSSFQLEQGYDTLFIYNGSSINSPLIGAYTGNNSPGTVLANSGSATLRFKSDGATQTSGFKATYQCLQDQIKPVTSINTSQYPWVTSDFTATFNDSDNVAVEKSFYQVIDNNNGDWRANANRGFFSDNFDGTTIHADWTIVTGNWSIQSNNLVQTDESNSNTNIYAYLNQMLSNRYLYHWQWKMEGIGNNRRAGFHYFCDSAQYPNRKNSYFVWYRLDNAKIQLYKVSNDVFSLVAEVPYTFAANQWYDSKVIFDRITGKHWIYINDQLVLTWTDNSPHINGNYVSFRSGNSKYTVNNLKVYRSRYPVVTVTVGNPSADIRYQSQNPNSIAAKVKSIVMDQAANLSTIVSKDLYVDRTPPYCSSVLDGLSNDEDYTSDNTQLHANWAMVLDSQSSTVTYWVAFGTAPGTDDIVPWTNVGFTGSFSASNLNLAPGTYYASVVAQNGAGLLSDTCASDGITYNPVSNTSEIPTNNSEILLYPNPSYGEIVIKSENPLRSLELYDTQGKLIFKKTYTVKTYQDNILLTGEHKLSSGIYYMHIFQESGNKTCKKFVLQQ